MKHRTALLAAALAAAHLAAAPGARGQVTAADIDALVAEKFLGAADWGPTNRQGELGLATSWRWREWPVLAAVDFLAASREVPIASGSYTRQLARTFELDLGPRKIWRPVRGWRPFLGGGLALAYAEIDNMGGTGPNPVVPSRDEGAGYWVDGGVFMMLGDAVNVGFDARFSSADVRLFGSGRDVGGLQVGLLAGYHFGE